MSVWLLTLLTITGALLGSFAGAIITRYPHTSALDGRSRCPRCGTQLRAADLIPLLSFLFLRGKCRYCQREVDATYPIAETLAAIGLPLIAWLVPQPQFFIPTAALWMVSIILAGIDFRTMKLPNEWTATAGFLSAVLLIAALTTTLNPEYAWRWGAGFLGTAAFYIIVTLITRGKGMGMGDVKLAPLITATVALVSLPAAVLSVFLPFVLGTLMVMYRWRKGIPLRGDIVPFGPFLITAGWLSALAGEDLWQWYAHLF